MLEMLTCWFIVLVDDVAIVDVTARRVCDDVCITVGIRTENCIVAEPTIVVVKALIVTCKDRVVRWRSLGT